MYIQQLATRVQRDKTTQNLLPGEKITYCECCARQIQKVDQSILCDNIELSFLGSAYIAYLEFIKFCVKLLMTFFLSSGLFNIITNAAFGEDCIPPNILDDKSLHSQSTECIKNWVTIFSLGNKRSRNNLMISQSFFNMISILLCVVIFQRFRFHLRKIDQKCDEKEVLASDYALLIKNIPAEFTYNGDFSTLDYSVILKDFLHKNLAQNNKNEKNIKKFNTSDSDKKTNHIENQDQFKQQSDQIQIEIDNLDKEEPKLIEIVSVGLCYDLEKYYKIENNLNNLKKKLSRCKKENEKIKLKDLIEKIQIQLDDFSKQYVSLGQNRYKLNNFTKYAYVILQYEEDQQRVQDFYKEIECITSLITGNKTQKLTFQGHEIGVMAAPDPNNIFWKNLHHSKNQLAFRRSALFLTTLMVLGGCLGLLFSFQLIQMKVGAENNKDSPIVSIMSYTISISILLLNAGVQQSIFMIASKEARSTKAGFFDSVVVKHAVANFLNTSVLLFIIQVFIYTDGDGYGKMFKAGGLAYNMNSIFMTNMIVQNAVQFINIPYYLAKSIKLSFKKLENSDKLQKLVSQQEKLNQQLYTKPFYVNILNCLFNIRLFENPVFDLQRQYSVIIASIFSALFYAPIIPFSLIWTMIQLFLKYWVDKYSIIKKSTNNVGANINLCLQVLENLEYALPIYSLSNLIFFVYISKTNEVDQLSILGVIIGIVHAILPMQFFNEKIYKIEDNVSNLAKYDDVKLDFLTDYDRENPIKKDAAMRQHYKALKTRAKQENKIVIN